MNNRKFCACGCRRSVADRRRGTKWATPTCRSSWRSRQESAQRGSGGLQVSYAKAVDAVSAGLERVTGETPEMCQWVARDWLRLVLPARQRARLEARTR